MKAKITIVVHDNNVPDDPEEREEFRNSILKYGVDWLGSTPDVASVTIEPIKD